VDPLVNDGRGTVVNGLQGFGNAGFLENRELKPVALSGQKSSEEEGSKGGAHEHIQEHINLTQAHLTSAGASLFDG
jgi:hypothetical protein